MSANNLASTFKSGEVVEGFPETKGPDRSCTERLLRAEHVRNFYCHVIPEGWDWKQTLRPEYWTPQLYKIRPGDRIEVRTADRLICFEIYVIDVSERVDPPLFDVSYRAVHPLDLDLPVPTFREFALHNQKKSEPRYLSSRRYPRW